ncbi:MAG: DctP family TRAP transporter solute-binding subunit [Syntrophobacteraceae bacterium]
MKSKRNLTWSWLLMVIMSLTFSMTAAGAEGGAFKEEYKLTLNVGPNFYWGIGAAKFAELVKEKTGGKIIVKPYYNSALLKGAQLQSPQMVARGIIDCAVESTINASTVIPSMNIFSFPFFINTFENLDKMEDGRTGKTIFAEMEKIGLKPLAWAENGFRQLTNGKRAVEKPEDVKGMRIRVVGSPIFIDTFRQLGADPVNMNWGDAVTAFQQGVVDGQENPVGVLIPVQIHQYHKFATFWNYLADPLIIYWNKEQWDAFPPDIRKGIQEAADEAGRFEKALARAGLDGDKSLKILKEVFSYTMETPDPVKFLEEKGMNVSFLSEAQVNAFKEAVKPVHEKWASQVGKDVYEGALADMAR